MAEMAAVNFKMDRLTKQQMEKVKAQKKILQNKKINLKHQQRFLKLPKKQKLNLAMYQL